MRRHLIGLGVALLLAGCGIPFAQRQGLALGVHGWALACDAERKLAVQPAPDGPVCLAAKRCDAAAGPVIMGTATRSADMAYANSECARVAQ